MFKDGYLARYQQKFQPKPEIKKYNIQDYRNLKKEIELSQKKDTGKLGFDFDNEAYRQKVSVLQSHKICILTFNIHIKL